MTPFRSVTGAAAVLDEDEVDTDIIFPARFLLLLDKAGLGRHAFHERRAKGDFVLDRSPFDTAKILVAGRNFGTGSSREQAVWALADFGIRVVIAPSFGEIFFANCFKNGMLPIVRTPAEHAGIRAVALAGTPITVDLEAQTIVAPGLSQSFRTEPYRRDALLRGLDEIGSILAGDAEAIAGFEARQRQAQPWLWLRPDQLAHFDDLEREHALG